MKKYTKLLITKKNYKQMENGRCKMENEKWKMENK
jgi:hypothetical protein